MTNLTNIAILKENICLSKFPENWENPLHNDILDHHPEDEMKFTVVVSIDLSQNKRRYFNPLGMTFPSHHSIF